MTKAKQQANRVSFFEERTVKWNDRNNSILMIDHTLLPKEFRFLECKTVPHVVEAIKTMRVRGAPAIGVTGAMGLTISILSSNSKKKKGLLNDIKRDSVLLKSARPTAVNLSWGVDKVLEFVANFPEDDASEIGRASVEFAKKLADEDVEANKKLSDLGQQILEDGDRVLTHCK